MKRCVCYYVLGLVGGVIVGAIYRYVHWSELKAADWAAWVQAVGGIVAIFAAFGVARYTIRSDQRRKAQEDRVAKAADLLALHHIAAELQQMCLLTNFEKSNYSEGTIYPNASGEFSAIVGILAKFPIVNIAALGELESFLALRRTAIFCSNCFAKDRGLKGDEFVLKYRTEFEKYHARCRELSNGMWERVEAIAPGHYSDKRRTHL